MKRGLSAIVLFAFLIIASVNFIIAQNENLSAPQRGLQCLEDILETQLCGQLSVETETFVLLATDECQSELEDDMDATNNCWPAGDCDILTTARAIFALSKAGVDTSDSEAWLLAQNQTTDELTWYLQIETESQAASCTINYNSNSDEISVNADNTLTITRGASGCFNLARDNYWLEVNSNCFDSQFEISCNQDFATTLLFQKPGSDTIHISSEIHSSSSDTPTYEKVNSVCFANPGEECNYEGSLWAAFILNELDYREEIIPYAPYLITIAEDNSNLLPDAFLYRISGFNEYKDQVMDLQTPGGNDEGSWGISTPVNRHYDTALAMFLLNIRPDNAISWLEDNQDDTGCWNNNNLIDTSFILYSAWYGAGLGGIGGGVTPGDGTTTPVQDCEPSNGYCSDALDCIDAGGNALDYDCTFGLDCCSINPEKSCSDLGGDICFADEDCS
ncbi:MAG TPA: hypothetical protein VJH65_00080, partial [Candidatus Nanoarchaeia archaeon]|nr:hypothetical protein [Candidatus Nanoarchaeia archaeon]